MMTPVAVINDPALTLTAPLQLLLSTGSSRLLTQAPEGWVLLHRLTIHGVAPWAEAAEAPPEGRIVAYFRPLMASVQDWILQP